MEEENEQAMVLASENHHVSSFRNAFDVLREACPELPKLPAQDLSYTISQALLNTTLTPLLLYRVASCLREGVLREIVQLLTYESSRASSIVARLLVVMRGLPGNLELALMFIEQHAESFANFEPRCISFFAFVCGPILKNKCDWDKIIKRAVAEDCPESKLALSCLFDVEIHDRIDPAAHVYDWDHEEKHSISPSFWRELRWASLARSLSISCGRTQSECPLQFSQDVTTRLPAFYGKAAQHYVRVCDVLMPYRCTSFNANPSAATKSGEIYEEETSTLHSMVITPPIREAMHSMSIYIAYGISFVLDGPVGCGKTEILSYLAKMTLRDEDKPSHVSKVPGVTFIQMDSAMISSDGDSFISLVGEIVPLPTGGGFTWRPGPIGLAVERGDWLIFENIGSAARNISSALPVILQLANAKPGDFLSAPGRGDPIRVAKGFRCIATRSLSCEDGGDSGEPPGGWNTWHRVRMPSLSTCEKIDLLKALFSSVSDCAERVVKAVELSAGFIEAHRSALMRRPTLREAVRICRRLENTRLTLKTLSVEIAVAESFDILAAWCGNMVQEDNLLSILAQSWSIGTEVIRTLCFVHQPEIVCEGNWLRIGRACGQRISNSSWQPSSKFSLNGHTLRLLELILRALEMKEHVLLVGETGSGKTTVIQELALLLNKELVVVNLSRQSDIGDLVGGFRPIEIEDAMAGLGRKFEHLFCKVMSKQKNSAFLDALQRACASEAQHDRAVRLMTGSMKAILKSFTGDQDNFRSQWDSIGKDLERLSLSVTNKRDPTCLETKQTSRHNSDTGAQPPLKRLRSSCVDSDKGESPSTSKPAGKRRRSKLGFAYSEGVLVKAMRDGKWILLDEINLAPSELLERIVSVMDRGEIALSNENGDLVCQSPGFALFGAMNPPTDVGKHFLPEVMRTRFTELNVRDMIDRDDIVRLAKSRFFQVSNDSFGLSEEECAIANNITSFYIECRSLAEDGGIEDSVGRPVRFSLRTFSRMLDFAAGVKRFIGNNVNGIRRILYEASIVAFCTSLPVSARSKVIRLADTYILGANERKGRCPPKLPPLPFLKDSMRHVRMIEGFPVTVKSPEAAAEPESGPAFVLSSAVKSTLRDICRALLVGAPQLPILLQGPTGAGKTSIVKHLAKITGNNLIRINNHEHTELSEYIGGYVATLSGTLVYSEGPLVQAARKGDWIMLDELNLAPPDVLEALNRLLDDNREVFIPETGETVKAAKGFRLFATQNPPGLYGGRKELSKAFRSRFVEIGVNELPDSDLLFILEKRSGIPQSFVRRMIAVMRELQMRRKTSGLFSGREGYVTARDLFRWSVRDPRSREELAIHGFFLLGERLRLYSERKVVRDIMIRLTEVSAVVLSDEYLYGLRKSPSLSNAADECFHRSLKILGIEEDHLRTSLSKSGVTVTISTKRMINLVVHCMAYKEPTLLVGPTGGGKTTICEAICDAGFMELLAINCHHHTEASDLLGGFRPVRDRGESGAVFEWSDGPLVRAMKRGSAFLIDEINMAEDAVIERLNSVLEAERSLLLSEKGSVPRGDDQSTESQTMFADSEFRVLATMNPGGDYGKRELSPALRNRFTELWIPRPDTVDDYMPIIHDRLTGLIKDSSFGTSTQNISNVLHRFLDACLQGVLVQTDGHGHSSQIPFDIPPDFYISLRDLRTWCDFMMNAVETCGLEPIEALMHGARVVFLDGLSVGATHSSKKAEESRIWYFLLSLMPPNARDTLEKCRFNNVSDMDFNTRIEMKEQYYLKVDNFFILHNHDRESNEAKPARNRFSFDAPNTRRNIARLARALSIASRPVLLEGPPGCGKSSLVEALAEICGHSFVRINLSESTEMTDLLGTDGPDAVQGSFQFQEGPLLKAMTNSSWVLLDELNLASQSVLEGLNSLLDHRRSVFIPETNDTIRAHPSFLVFGAQNPAIDGGGRRVLPRSFLNRFTRVAFDPPSSEDILQILRSTYDEIPDVVTGNIVKALHQLRDDAILSCESLSDFGLRDALRWCDVLSGIPLRCPSDSKSIRELCLSQEYVRMSFDISVLQGIMNRQHQLVAEAIFEKVFGFPWAGDTVTPSLRPRSDREVRIGLVCLRQRGDRYCIRDLEPLGGLLKPTELRSLQALGFAVEANWPVVLLPSEDISAHDDGKRLVKVLAMICGKSVRIVHGGSITDAESLLGGYSQKDVIRCVRKVISLGDELLRAAVRVLVSDEVGSSRAEKSEMITELYLCHRRLHRIYMTHSNAPYPHNKGNADIALFLSLALWFTENIRHMHWNKNVQYTVDEMISYCEEIKELEARRRGDYNPIFNWKKSDIVNAIETGEWIFLQNSEMCPPAVLDRLNPLFERPAVAPEHLEGIGVAAERPGILLAEAPSQNDGSSLFIKPHPDFRIFFAVSTDAPYAGKYGLSRPLLDRSLRICLKSIPAAVGFPETTYPRVAGKTSTLRDNACCKLPNLKNRATSLYDQFDENRLSHATSTKCIRSVAPSSSQDPGENLLLQEKGTILLSPLTSGADFALSPENACIDRDLAIIRDLVSLHDDYIDRSLRNGVLSSEWTRDVLTCMVGSPEFLFSLAKDLHKKDMLSASAEAFCLGSSNKESMMKRIAFLESSSIFRPIKPIDDLREGIINGFACSFLGKTIGFNAREGQAVSFLSSIDPVYAMDRIPALLTDASQKRDLRDLLHSRAIYFRNEFLGLYGFEAAWKKLVSSKSIKSLFFQARLQSELRLNQDIVDFGDTPLEVACYEIVSYVAGDLERYREALSDVDGWGHPQEECFFRMFEILQQICIALEAEEAKKSSLLALLWMFTTAAEGPHKNSRLSGLNSLQNIIPRIQKVCNGFNQFSISSELSTVAHSKRCQDVERLLSDSLKMSRRVAFTVSEVDAIVKAAVTVTTPKGEKNGKFVDQMLNFSADIVRRKLQQPQSESSACWTQALSPFRCAVRAVTLSLMEELLSAVICPQSSGKASDQDTRPCASDIKSLLSQLKLLPVTQPEPLLTVQRLVWMLELRNGDSPQIPSLGYLSNSERSILLFSTLQERNSFHGSVTPGKGLDVENLSDLTTVVFRSSQSPVSGTFWKLAGAYHEAAVTTCIIGRNLDVGNTGQFTWQNLLLSSLISALSLASDDTNEINDLVQNLSLESARSCLSSLRAYPISASKSSLCSLQGKAELQNFAISRLLATLESSNSSSASVNDGDMILACGTAWMTNGIFRLHCYSDLLYGMKGIDPSELAQCKALLLLEASSRVEARLRAYRKMSENRLGGDAFKSCQPAKWFNQESQETFRLLEESISSYIYRDPTKPNFESYVGIVNSVKSSIVDVIIKGRIFERMPADGTEREDFQNIDECSHLIEVCKTVSQSLCIHGNYFQFRDVSLHFRLGIEEIAYGLRCCIRALQTRAVYKNKKAQATHRLLSDLSLLPRAAYRDAREIGDTISLCAEIVPTGKALMSSAHLLIETYFRSERNNAYELSEFLGRIVNIWKTSHIRAEAEVEKKNSLHVLRQSSKRYEVEGTTFPETAEASEQQDYCATFNPLTEDIEEQILGLDSGDVLALKISENLENDTLTIDPSSFWKLHQLIFPGSEQYESNDDVTSFPCRSHSLLSFASDLPDYLQDFEDVASYSGSVIKVWAFLCSHSVTKSVRGRRSSEHSESFDSTDEHYNFYADPNIAEIRKSAVLLIDLKAAIVKTQSVVFNDSGDHPVLGEITTAIDRVAKSSRGSTPLSVIIVGLENVLRKADEWNRLFASRETKLGSEVIAVSKLVSAWRLMEMECWPKLLEARLSASKRNAEKWMFLLYDAVINGTLSCKEESKRERQSVLSAVDQFLRSSPSGEFSRRLEIVDSLVRHLLSLQSSYGNSSELMGKSLRGLCRYYHLFEESLLNHIGHQYDLVLKELLDFKNIVSYNPGKDLGSSEEMSRRKDKHFDYFRLKAASEKTRRRLHKLCLKVDALLLVPFFQHMERVKSASKFVYDHQNEATVSKNRDSSDICRALSVETLLKKIRVTIAFSVPSEASLLPHSSRIRLLVSHEALRRKLSTYGQRVEGSNRTKCDIASKFSSTLQSTVRDQVLLLRGISATNNIQLKRRALARLLKGLYSVGLCPFEKATAVEPLQWLSVGDPSSSLEFNQAANHLYITGIYQFQRLKELSDSSIRNNDISSEEASRFRALCQDLLQKASLERDSLDEYCAMLIFLSRVTTAFTSIREVEHSKTKWDSRIYDPVREMILRLRRVVSTIEQLTDIVADARECASDSREIVSRRNLMSELLETHHQLGERGLTELHAILRSCCDVMKAETKDMELMDLDYNSSQETKYFDGSFHDWCNGANSFLHTIVKVLEESISKASAISKHNIVTEVLSPVLVLGREGLTIMEAEHPISLPSHGFCDKVFATLCDNSEKLIRTVLISAQQAIEWSDVNVHEDQKEEGELPREKSLELFPRFGIRDGHRSIADICSALHILDVVNLVKLNLDTLERLKPFCATLSAERISQIIGLQRALGLVLKEYINSLLLPCLRKIGVMHIQNLSLLKTLLSLFGSLCKEGFCRPEKHEETLEGESADGKTGTGFGDAADGDLTCAQDVSDQIEDEEQLLGLQGEQMSADHPNSGEQKGDDGFQMTTDFDGELHDIGDMSDGSNEEVSDGEKQLGTENERGENELDEKMWDVSDDEGNQPTEQSSQAARKDNFANHSSKRSHEWAAGERNEDDCSGKEQTLENESDTEKDQAKSEEPKSPSNESALAQEPKLGSPKEVQSPSQSQEQKEAEVEKLDLGEENSNAKESMDSDPKGAKADLDPKHGLDEEDSSTLPTQQDEIAGFENVEDKVAEETDALMSGQDETSYRDEEPSGDQKDFNDQDAAEKIPEDINLSELEDEEERLESDPLTESMCEENKNQKEIEECETPADESGAVSGPTASEQSKELKDSTSHSHPAPERLSNQEERKRRHDVPELIGGQSTTGQLDGDFETGIDAAHGFGGLNLSGSPEDLNDNRSTPSGVADQHRSTRKTQADAQGDGKAERNASTKKGKENDNEAGSSIDTNPFRISDPSDLIEKWDEYLRTLRDHTDEARKQSREPASDDGGEAWEFNTHNDGNDADMHALGAANEDQQRPLPSEEKLETGKEDVQAQRLDLMNTDNADLPTDEIHSKNPNWPRSHEEESNQDCTQNSEEAGMSQQVEKPHPAKLAAKDRRTERRSKALRKTFRRHDSLEFEDSMAVDFPDEMEESRLVAPCALPWKIENIDDSEAKDLWHKLDSKVAADAASLCEQLRLVLEATDASRMGGGFRTGKRLNMRRVIEYVASDFQRDRIWLRRVKPDRRSYDIMIAIDDSASMIESEAGAMATESLVLVTSALAKLEVGRVSVVSFGAEAKLIRDFHEPLPISSEKGGKLLQHFTFAQSETNIVNLLGFISSHLGSQRHSRNLENMSLAFIISDGRLSDREEVRRHLRKLKDSNVLVAFLILDQKHVEVDNSIYDVQRVEYDSSGKLCVTPYMQNFPIDFYAVVQDMHSLPTIVADALRQWLEVSNTL